MHMLQPKAARTRCCPVLRPEPEPLAAHAAAVAFAESDVQVRLAVAAHAYPYNRARYPWCQPLMVVCSSERAQRRVCWNVWGQSCICHKQLLRFEKKNRKIVGLFGKDLSSGSSQSLQHSLNENNRTKAQMFFFQGSYMHASNNFGPKINHDSSELSQAITTLFYNQVSCRIDPITYWQNPLIIIAKLSMARAAMVRQPSAALFPCTGDSAMANGTDDLASTGTR